MRQLKHKEMAENTKCEQDQDKISTGNNRKKYTQQKKKKQRQKHRQKTQAKTTGKKDKATGNNRQ